MAERAVGVVKRMLAEQESEGGDINDNLLDFAIIPQIGLYPGQLLFNRRLKDRLRKI